MSECKGKNCEALYGIGHSDECLVEHDLITGGDGNIFAPAKVDLMDTAGNRHPDARYRGYSNEPLESGASQDRKNAWEEGYIASRRIQGEGK